MSSVNSPKKDTLSKDSRDGVVSDSRRDPLLAEILRHIDCGVIQSKEQLLNYFSTLSEPLAYGMGKYLRQMKMDDEEFVHLMRFVVYIAMEYENLRRHYGGDVTSVIKQGSSETRELNRQLVAAILARSFLCLHSDKGRTHLMPQINFTETFAIMQSTEIQKIRCVMNYFDRLERGEYKQLRDKHLFFERVCLSDEELLTLEGLRGSGTPLCDFQVDTSRRIEDTDAKYAKVDFANKYLGGGVLNTGCLQEEITFTICPELISGMLLMEAMNDKEAIIISGFDIYSKYSGYARSLKYEKDFVNNSNAHNWLIAIDAMELHNDPSLQYLPNYMLREINKAYAGFKKFTRHDGPDQRTRMTISKRRYDNNRKLSPSSPNATNTEAYPDSIATGNWGCGAFGGDPQLKSLLQWLAASEAGCRQLLYCTMEHPDLKRLKNVTEELSKLKTVGNLVTTLQAINEHMGRGQKLFSFFDRKHDKCTIM